ncbi:DUF5946 family protein [Deinococcus radiophilus]|uniref:Uncharacterized protein n=1 Tax=Deinococcus radiophilus TaxID=32062 RepID=A0A431VSA3_9DEIO|nr:DUF5946 family protein [Deinococcus radiophilus]RTR26128.1 hypothetical protein EJ104_09045 [Deinococcus radiophilus]UFA51609.1 DUF5946 family protein [Deinococcus radiophilus]
MALCDCGALVPTEDGPSHAYMSAQPACWRCYGELLARLAAEGVDAPLQMDTYAAQHPGNAPAERRQRGSVAVHLTVLCAHFDFGLPFSQLPQFRARLSSTLLPRLGLEDWPALNPPQQWGPLNAPVILSFPVSQLEEVTYEWARQVWEAWRVQETPVQFWAQTLMETDYDRRG